MARRDPERTQKLRVAIRHLIENQALEKGIQSRLARHFNVSRQRVHQLVQEERQRRQLALSQSNDIGTPQPAAR